MSVKFDPEGPRRSKKDPVRLRKLKQTNQAAFTASSFSSWFCLSFWLYVRLSFYHLVSCAFVGLAVRLSTCLSILKAGMHNREAEMTVHLSPPENNNEHFY